MSKQMRNICDDLAVSYQLNNLTEGLACKEQNQAFKAGFDAGFDAAMERAKILEEALNALIIDAIPCTESENPKQFFITAWSFDKAKDALSKFRGEK